MYNVQKIFAAILLLAFIGQTFRQGFYYVDYLVDKAEYVKNCVNKARPKMLCNGKCQLMKKIQEQEKDFGLVTCRAETGDGE